MASGGGMNSGRRLFRSLPFSHKSRKQKRWIVVAMIREGTGFLTRGYQFHCIPGRAGESANESLYVTLRSFPVR